MRGDIPLARHHCHREIAVRSLRTGSRWKWVFFGGGWQRRWLTLLLLLSPLRDTVNPSWKLDPSMGWRNANRNCQKALYVVLTFSCMFTSGYWISVSAIFHALANFEISFYIDHLKYDKFITVKRYAVPSSWKCTWKHNSSSSHSFCLCRDRPGVLSETTSTSRPWSGACNDSQRALDEQQQLTLMLLM